MEEFKVYSDNGSEIEIYQDIPESLTRHKLREFNAAVAVGGYGTSIFQYYMARGFEIWISHYFISANATLVGRGDRSLLELRIPVFNSIDSKWEGIAEPVLEPMQFSLDFTPHINNRSSFVGGKHYATCDFHFTKEYLSEISGDFPVLAQFLEKVERKEPAVLSDVKYYCSPDMINAVNFVMHNPFKTAAQKYIIEVKAQELLIAALERVSFYNEAKPLKLTNRDKDALREVKLIIESRLDDPMENRLLSKKAGMNMHKFKTGFKMLFGTSPYDYHYQMKMREAKRLLLEEDMQIQEVAYTLNYKHVSTFSMEFKKLFGCTPKYFKEHGKL